MNDPDARPVRDPDPVLTPEGVRPQRSTEEHGKGHVEVPGAEPPHQRLAGPGPEYPVAHAEPRGADAHAAGGRADDDHATGAHGDGHAGTDTDASHAEPALGPIDRAAWGAGALGIAIGVAIALLFMVATLPK